MSTIQIVVEGKDQATGVLQKIDSALKSLGQTGSTASRGLGLAGTALKGLVVGAAAGAGLAAISALTTAAGGLGDAVIGMNARLEQSQIAFETMLGSGDKAKAFLDELADFAAKTPFNFPELIKSSQMMLGMGFAGEQVIPVLTDVGNAVAAIGGDSELISRTILQLGQMQAKAKVSGEEMRTLASSGIPVWRMLSEHLNKSIAETMKLSEQGKISSQVFLEAFHKFSQANYGDMMARQSMTFSGAMSTISDSLQMAAATAFKPFFDRISELAVRIATFVSSDSFGPWAAGVATQVNFTLSALGILVSGFDRSIRAIVTILNGYGPSIHAAMSWLDPTVAHSPALVDAVESGTQRIIEAYKKAGHEVPAALSELAAQQTNLNATIAAQEAAVKAAERALRPLEQTLKAQQDRLSSLRNELSQAQQSLTDFMNAPLVGSRAFSDAIFANDQQVKSLQKRLLEIQLGPKFPGQTKEVYLLQRELERLQKQGELTRLDESLQLDPLRRQLQQLADDTQEVTFEEAAAGIMSAKQRISELTPAVAASEAQIKNLQDTISSRQDVITTMRDGLTDLRDVYQNVGDAIQDWGQKLQDTVAKVGASVGGGGGLSSLASSIEKLAPTTKTITDWANWKRDVESDLTGVNEALQLIDMQKKVDSWVVPLEQMAGQVTVTSDTATVKVGEMANSWQRAWGFSSLTAQTASEEIGTSTNNVSTNWQTMIKNFQDNPLGTLFSGWASGVRLMLGDVVSGFQAMADEVVGHSIVPDMIDGIIAEFVVMRAATMSTWQDIHTAITTNIEKARDSAWGALDTMSYVAMYDGAKIQGYLTTAFNAVTLSVVGEGGLVPAVQTLIDKLAAIPTEIVIKIKIEQEGEIPDEVVGHSPSPLEIGLRGISSALREMPVMQIPGFSNAMTPAYAGMVAGGVGGFTVNGPLIGTAVIKNDLDIEAVSYQIVQEIARRRR